MKHPLCLAGLALAGVLPIGAATAPYFNDFSGTGSNTALTELTDADWTVTGGVYRYAYSSTTITPSPASVPITNLAGVNFRMETQFTVSSAGTVNSNGETLGFGLFGASSGFGGSGTSSAYYLADFQYANTASPGTLRILALGDTTGTSATNTTIDDNAGVSTLAVVLGKTYTLRLDGTFSGSTLNMTLGLYDSTGATQIGTSAVFTDLSPLTGTNFGYRNRTGLGGGTATIDFDNLSIAAIPEPNSALALGGLALCGTLITRRRPSRRS